MTQYVLSIDQGTTGTTVALLDSHLRIHSKVNSEFEQVFPQPGWVEHRLEDIWTSVLRSIQATLDKGGVSGKDIAAIGITNQRETTAVWNRTTGQPLYNAIVWQCRRTTPLCQHLKDNGHESLFKKKTGLVLDPYFSGTKLSWLLENITGLRKEAKRQQVCFGTIDTFLVSRLTNQQVHVTDVSNASRTLLMNLKNLSWDEELLDVLQIPIEVLPDIRSSSEIYGTTHQVPGLPDGIPVSGIAGDQQAALFGQLCFEPGQMKCTYGTGAFVLMNTGPNPIESHHGLLSTVGWKIGNEISYALEGSIFIAGAAVQWLRDGLHLISDSDEIESLASSVDTSDGVVFVPALVGLGAPHWNPHARGLICQITRGTTAAHLARATLEGIAFQVRDVIETMQRETSDRGNFLRVDGGAAKNSLLLQFQSDILGVDIHRPKTIETTALGAALLAGLGVGFWSDRKELMNLWQIDRIFSPSMERKKVEEHLLRWQHAVEKA